MLKGHWLRKPAARRSLGVVFALVFAAVVVVLLWPSAPRIPVAQGLESFEAFFSAIDPDCADVLARREDFAGTPKQIDDCSEKQANQRKGYRDLAQSVRSANAAEDAAWLSYLQTRAAIVGAALVLLTLGATAWAAWAAADAAQIARESAFASERAADSAEQSVAIAADSAQRQLRAYVSNVATAARGFGRNFHFEATVTITNSGQTPAHDVTIKLAIVVATEPFADFEINVIGPLSKSHLAAGAQLTPFHRLEDRLDEANYQAILAGTKTLYLFGEVDYLDVFNKPHKTRFRFFLGKDQMKHAQPVLSVCPEGNEAT